MNDDTRTVSERHGELAAQIGISDDQLEEFARALMEFSTAVDSKPIIYTNRAARRARARAERKSR